MKERKLDLIDALVLAILVIVIETTAMLTILLWHQYVCLVQPVEPSVSVPETSVISPIEDEQEHVEEPEEVVIEVEYERLYTDEDAIALAKMCWGEARGVTYLETSNGIVSAECQKEAVMWVALNRYDAGYSDSIVGVVAAPKQFSGYSERHPVDSELLDLAYSVLDKWNSEKHGETSVGRVLPSDYHWFHGDGNHNWFRNAFRGADGYWEWSTVA